MFKWMLVLTLSALVLCGYAQEKNYNPKLSINKKIAAEFEKVKDTAVVFDAFKDCRCGIDTIGKKIIIFAGRSDDHSGTGLAMNIDQDFIASVSQHSWNDVIRLDSNGVDTNKPFVIENFLIEADKNPFSGVQTGFLLKYRLSKNIPYSGLPWKVMNSEQRQSTITKLFQLGGYVNCHHVKYLPEARRTKSDTAQIIQAVLNDTLLKKQLKAGNHPQPVAVSKIGAYYVEFLRSKSMKDRSITETVPTLNISSGFTFENTIDAVPLNWKYYINGDLKFTGYVMVSKFANGWFVTESQN